MSASAWGSVPAAPPPPPQPGIVPLRPLAVGDVLDGAIAAVRSNPRTMLGLSAVVLLGTTLLTTAAAAAMDRWLFDLPGATQLPAETFDLYVYALAAWVVRAVLGGLTWAVALLLSGVLAVAVARAVQGERLVPREAWAYVRPVAVQLVGTALLVLVLVAAAPVTAVVLVLAAVAFLGVTPAVVALAVLLGLAAAAGSVWVQVRLAFAPTVVVLESDGGRRPVGPVRAVLRSSDLVAGAWWRTCGQLVLVAVLASVVSGAVSSAIVLVSGVRGASTVATLVVEGVGTLLGALLTAPFAAAAITLVYVDRRIRTERLAEQLARR